MLILLPPCGGGVSGAMISRRKGASMRKVDELFERYGESHRNPANKAIHWVCVPAITWSVLAALWAAAPVAAYIGIALAIAFYVWLSLPLAVGMLVVLAAMVYPL